MSERVLFEQTADRQVWLIRDGENMIIETISKVDDLFEANRSARADFSRTSSLGPMVKSASIPLDMHWDWFKQGIMDDPKALKRRLNDSDYLNLRTNSLRL